MEQRLDDKAAWDDYALVNSWNEALEEYKKYHSVHAKGGNTGDLMGEGEAPARSNAPITDRTGAGQGDVRQRVSTAVEPGGEEDEEEGEVLSTSEGDVAPAAATGTAHPPLKDATTHVPVAFPPHAVLGSVQDESLKRLMMSWYYAGYYTGLYEGQQQAQQGWQGMQG